MCGSVYMLALAALNDIVLLAACCMAGPEPEAGVPGDSEGAAVPTVEPQAALEVRGDSLVPCMHPFVTHHFSFVSFVPRTILMLPALAGSLTWT